MMFVVSLPYFSLMLIQIHNMSLGTLILVQPIICVGGHLFVELIEGVHENVNLGDPSKLPVEGKGKIKIYQKNGEKEYIYDVYYVPDMKRQHS